MSVERDRFLNGMARMAREDRRNTVRPALIKGRRNESNIDLSQMTVIRTIKLSDDAGNFLFVPGYSVLGGPDMIG